MSISKKNRSYCFISGLPRPIFGLYQRTWSGYLKKSLLNDQNYLFFKFQKPRTTRSYNRDIRVSQIHEKIKQVGRKIKPIFFFGADSSLCLLPQHFYDQLGLICFLSKNCAIVFQRVQYLSQKMLYKIHSCRQLDKQFKLFWFKSFQLLNTEIGFRVSL